MKKLDEFLYRRTNLPYLLQRLADGSCICIEMRYFCYSPARAAALLALCLVAGIGGAAGVQPLDVYVLAGQSNMDGRASRHDLPKSLQPSQTCVLLYHSDRWAPLGPGSSERPAPPNGFGPELSFGHELIFRAPHQRVALIKHARGGTSLAVNWTPSTGPEFRAMVAKTHRALNELRTQGFSPRLRGFVWMQGERDASTAADAQAYGTRLHEFVRQARLALAEPELPVVIGRINAPDRIYRAAVRRAQSDIALSVPFSACVDTDDLTLLDSVHYDAGSLVILGRRFAAALAAVEAERAATNPRIKDRH